MKTLILQKPGELIVADTPGHEQYTRNMVTGASTADLAVILIDARKGVLTQTRRHSYLAHLIGIRNLVVAVNKMDLVDYDEAVFTRIKRDCVDFLAKLQLDLATIEYEVRCTIDRDAGRRRRHGSG